MNGPLLLDGEIVEGVRFAEPSEAFMGRVGVFETVAIERGVARCLPAHHARLARSCAELGLGEAPPLAVFERDLERLASKASSLAARLVVFRQGGVLRRACWASLPPKRPATARLGIAGAAFRARGDLARHKTLDWMGSVLALEDGRARGWDEVVFVAEDGALLEGARTSLFAVVSGALLTPPLRRPILPGVLRAEVLRLAAALGIPAREDDLRARDLEAGADEIFLTSSLARIWPVSEFEGGRRLAPGPLTRRLQGALGGPGP